MEVAVHLQHEAKHELDDTWKKMAVGDTRETLMPVARWLKKLLRRLNDLVEVFGALKEEGKKQAFDDMRSRGVGPNDGESPDSIGEGVANDRVATALGDLKEAEVSDENLMHTTKNYDMCAELRKRLNMEPFGSTGAPPKQEEPEEDPTPPQMHPIYDDEALNGDWNKSILISKKGKKLGQLGKNNKTFKEFRADPWERQQINKRSGDK